MASGTEDAKITGVSSSRRVVWGPAVRAGVVYFVLIFTLGFVMGALRVLAVAPIIGDIGAVLAELPVMLVASWMASRALLDVFSVGDGLAPRLIMGAVAFALLMIAEAGLSVLLFHRTLVENASSYRNESVWLGLLGQIVFAAIPALQRRLPSR